MCMAICYYCDTLPLCVVRTLWSSTFRVPFLQSAQLIVTPIVRSIQRQTAMCCQPQAGVVGGLELWDVRHKAVPVRASQVDWGHTGVKHLDHMQGAARQMLCLDVHPARPNLCATGSSGGTVVVWDLRMEAAPVTAASTAGVTGDVWEVRISRRWASARVLDGDTCDCCNACPHPLISARRHLGKLHCHMRFAGSACSDSSAAGSD